MTSLQADSPHKVCWPGVVLSGVLALLATQLSILPFWPFTDPAGHHSLDPVILAIILGLVVGNGIKLSARFSPGIKFSAKHILGIGIVLLGARLDFTDLLRVGSIGILLSILVVGFTFVLFFFLAKPFGLTRIEGLLLAVGTAICGGTAILAIAPLLKAKEEKVVMAVGIVVMLGLLAMFVMPPIAGILNMTPWQFGVWAGLTIHQTPQVLAASFNYDPLAGQTATIIKLSRVCLLAPVAFFIGLAQIRGALKQSGPNQPIPLGQAFSLIPNFIFGFLALALARSLGLIPDMTLSWVTPFFDHPVGTSFELRTVIIHISSFLLAIAMAAVGLETNFSVLKRMSVRPFLAAGLGSLIIATLSLIIIRLL
jgi:uncharacterized integral membrane protein (TIGR00698 family)